MTKICLSKQQALNADPKTIQQIKFTEDLDRTEGTIIIEKTKITFSDLRKNFVRVL